MGGVGKFIWEFQVYPITPLLWCFEAADNLKSRVPEPKVSLGDVMVMS